MAAESCWRCATSGLRTAMRARTTSPLASASAAPTWLVGARRRRASSSATGRDRKSTRLNSSHGYISYAVFCLKKKNHHPASEHTGRHERPPRNLDARILDLKCNGRRDNAQACTDPDNRLHLGVRRTPTTD